MTRTRHPGRLRLASYNIRKAVGLDWRRDPDRIIDVIAELEADVVALQEVDRRLGERPATLPRDRLEAATGLCVAPLARNAVSLGWHGNVLLVRHGLAAEGAGHLHLPGIEPRGAVSLRLGAPFDLTFVGVHLGLRRGCRQLQFRSILAALRPQTRARSVIMGDFNEWSPRTGLAPLEAEFDVVQPGRSFHASRPVACLDRFALGRQIRLVESGVLRSPRASRASDHLPVWAEIEIAADNEGPPD